MSLGPGTLWPRGVGWRGWGRSRLSQNLLPADRGHLRGAALWGQRVWGCSEPSCSTSSGRGSGTGEPAPTHASAILPTGTSSGLVLVFDIPPKGTNVTVSQVLEQHRDAITDIAAELGQAPVRGDQRCGQRGRGVLGAR